MTQLEQEQASLIASLKKANAEKDEVIKVLSLSNQERQAAFETLEQALVLLEAIEASRRGFTVDGVRLQ